MTLADMIKRLTIKYDNLFEVTCPYSMGFHGKTNSDNHTCCYIIIWVNQFAIVMLFFAWGGNK